MQNAKQWLEAFGECHQKLELMLERYETLEAGAMSPRSTALDGMPHSHGGTADAIGNAVARLDDLRQKIERISSQEQQLYTERDSEIDRISGKNAAYLQTVLRCRYLDLMPWEAVNQVIFGAKADFDERQESYQRQVFCYHKAGLMALEKLLNK